MQEKQKESYNSRLAQSVKTFFPPSWLEILIYSLVACLLLGLLNYRVFLGGVGINSGFSGTTLDGYLRDKLTGASDVISRLLQGRIASILFWAFLGSLIYMMIWVVQNLVINIENDVQAGKFVGLQAQTDRRRAYWHSVISSKVFFICSLLVLIIYGIALVNFFLPLASKSFGLAFSASTFPKNIISIAVSLIATAVFLYLLVLALRIVAHSWRWIIANF